MRISVIAAFGAAVFLSACQPASQTILSDGPPMPTSPLHPTQADYRLLTQYTGLAGYQKAIDAGTYNGTGVLYLNTKVVVDEKMGPAQNPLLSGLQSGGKPWQFTKRYAVQADDIVEFGAGIEGDGFNGNLAALTSLSGQKLLPWSFENMVNSKRTPSYEPKRGTLKRASGEVLYVLYGTSEQECLAFVQTQTSLYLTGDICAAPRQKIGKSRAEALIRSLGFNPAIPIEPLPDLSTLAVD